MFNLYICIFLWDGGWNPSNEVICGEHICFILIPKMNVWEIFQRFMCHWCCIPCFLSLCDCIFPCVTLILFFSSYMEHSVWWLEFICLCSIHRFRYYMICSTKVDMEFVLDALYWWVVPSPLLFRLDKWNDCNYVIILPLKNPVYAFWESFYMCMTPLPNGYVIVSTK